MKDLSKLETAVASHLEDLTSELDFTVDIDMDDITSAVEMAADQAAEDLQQRVSDAIKSAVKQVRRSLREYHVPYPETYYVFLAGEWRPVKQEYVRTYNPVDLPDEPEEGNDV